MASVEWGYSEGVLSARAGGTALGQWGIVMGLGGTNKDAAGEVAGNDGLRVDGNTDQDKAELRQAAENAEDMFKKH
ncbi:hypothetical protein AL755_13650 [Arthrobacter sp. ERGS1:01]|nr:hypothetical protein AL755_13650 [Arthrobacter sp. ERGS1:01]